MPNQWKHNRKWKEEIAETASRLSLCVVLPKKLAANQRIRFGCSHGTVTETVVHRMVGRQFCCKSAASASHPKEWYAQRARAMHKSGGHLYDRTDDHKDKISATLSTTLQEMKERGETHPGWGFKFHGDPFKDDVLYLVVVVSTSGDLHYKVGRSFYGPRERLQRSLVKVIGEWQGPHWLVWLTEQTLLKKHSGSRSRPTPILASTGGTECFSDELDIGAVVSYCDFLFAPAIG